jgi:undecaprenyl-diphosphatase
MEEIHDMQGPPESSPASLDRGASHGDPHEDITGDAAEPTDANAPTGHPPTPAEIAQERNLTRPLLIASFAGFCFLTWTALRPRPNRVDVAITTALQRPKSRRFFHLMRLVSAPGYAPFTHASVICSAADLWAVGYRLEGFFALATMGAGTLTALIKLVVKRPRPDARFKRMLVQLKDNSYPSGHATHYSVFFGYLFYLAYRRMAPAPLRTLILLVLGTLIVLVGPSRVYLGHHWASDVAAGQLVGLTYLFGMLQVYLYIEDLTT